MKKNEANSPSGKVSREKLKYTPAEIEPKWQAVWEEESIYQPDLENANPSTSSGQGRPFYNLMMFPYPSAEGLHVGSMYAFGGVDVYGRFKRMQGYAVFEPIGLDGFGIHSENHAIKTNSHPLEHAERTEKNFYRQLRAIGNSYAWKNKVETYDPAYYKWTQWIFIELFKAGLAYRKKSPVNYCPSCKTVLSDEQVINGKCERCGHIVEKKNLEQWFFKITEYADQLLANIPKLDWTEKVKIAQREWIGKKTGISITYKVANSTYEVEVFTTRPDTNFGATFLALAPEHPLVEKMIGGQVPVETEKRKEIGAYVRIAKAKTEIERQSEGREKTGVFTGLYAINQLTGYQMPIWVSDFVLSGFGTGALVGVPGHDKRDFEFASKFGLEIKRVVIGKDQDASPITHIKQVQEDDGIMTNSGFLNGMDIHEATERIMDYMEKHGYGRRETTYHLRDWLISRQRYWGPPIPMVYCQACAEKGLSWFDTVEAKKYRESRSKSQAAREESHDAKQMAGWYPVPDADLPVKLPYIEDFRPLGTGKSPLANHPEFYTVQCPHCGKEARRETDVSDNFLDSAWYYYRYLATDRDDMPFPSSKFNPSTSFRAGVQSATLVNRLRYLPVTMYIGGAEHSVLHLLYARFITMFLHDQGYLDFDEPFSRFYAHGLIIKEGAKMSKSKGNVVIPDEYIAKYGADTLRAYLMFLGPFNQGGDFRDSGIEGMHRFMKRVWALVIINQKSKIINQKLAHDNLRMMHATIKGVTEDLEALRFNTAIAKLMSWYNFLAKQDAVSPEEAQIFLQLLAPFAPHMTEELWQKLQVSKVSQVPKVPSIHTSAWPSYDPEYLREDMVTIPVQVNGKLRGMVRINSLTAAKKSVIEELAKRDERVGAFLKEKTIKHVIYIAGKVINFVVE